MHPVCNARMPDDRLLKSLVFGMVEEERRPGRPFDVVQSRRPKSKVADRGER